MGERLRKVRKILEITQQQLADKLGVSRSNIAGYEAGRNDPGDAFISLFCKLYNVNEEWLRHGSGEMFIEIDRENQLMIWSANILKDESDSFKKRFIRMLMDLNESDWETIEKIALALHKKD